MCSQYTLKTTTDQIFNELTAFEPGLSVSTPKQTIQLDHRYFPSSIAPVLVLDRNYLKLTPMKFSLVPSWSKDSKVKFATHNARIETILDKPTWSKPFESKHCVIPLTGFFESVYDGPLQGNVIQFQDPDQGVLYAAGIYDFWTDLEENEKSFFSFSILTREPSPFILKHGHDRTPIFLQKSFVSKWLNLKMEDKVMTGELMKENLLSYAYHPNLMVQTDRPLNAGWEKRK
jgi:putative SOS response-associated peptidase YedK